MDTRTNDFLREIGDILIQDDFYPLDGTLLFAEATQATASCAVFKDHGGQIVYRDPDERLFDIVMDLWNEHDIDKPWSTLEYQIHGSKFKARFTYADDPEYDPTDYTYREKVVRRYFGDKPIVYPPVSTSTAGLTYKL